MRHEPPSENRRIERKLDMLLTLLLWLVRSKIKERKRAASLGITLGQPVDKPDKP